MKRIAASLLAIVLVVAPTSVRSLGLGQIELQSRLNEPLLAQIPVHSLGDVDLASIRVTLGSREQFAKAGIERPIVLSALRFAFAGASEDAYVSVTTRKPVNEPFLNFLLAVDWSNGRMLREYTLLLDPPVYGAAIKTHTASVVKAVRTPPTVQKPLVNAPSPSSERAGAAAAVTYGPVKSTDTLWRLAERFRGDAAVSVQQMMLATLRLNPDAFNYSNINLLRRGAVLKIPSTVEAEELARREALAEVQRQHAAWQDLRSARASRPVRPVATAAVASPSSRQGAAASTQTAAPSISQAVVQQPAVKKPVSEADGGKLTLRSGGTATGGVGVTSGSSPEVTALRTELESVREEADASRREAEELAARVEEAEALVQELERLVKLRDADLAALQNQLSKTEQSVVAQSQGAASAPTVAPSATETAPSAPSAPAPVRTATPPAKPTGVVELLQSALGDIVPFDPVLLIGGVILVIVIAVVGIVFSRRRQSEADDEVYAGADTGADGGELAPDDEPAPNAMAPLAAPTDTEEAPPVTGEDASSLDAPGEDASSPLQTRSSPAEEGPLAEVNVYLAYERFEQAETLVRSAIESQPEHPEYRLKLLEIYHASRNAAAFTAAAAALRELVGDDHPMMDTARQWWGDVAPGTLLFASGGETITEDADSDEFIFDITSGDDEPRIPAEAAQTTTQLSDGVDPEGGVDFDLGLDFGSDDDEALLGEGTNVDFDLGLEEASSIGNATDLELEGEGADELSSELASDELGADTTFDFDLDGLDGGTEAVSEAPDSGSDGGIVLPVEEADFEATDLGQDAALDFALDDDEFGLGRAGARDDELVVDDPVESAGATGAGYDEAVADASGALELDVAENADVPFATEPAGTDTDLDFDLSAFDSDEGADLGANDEGVASVDPLSTSEVTALDLDLDLDTLAETSEISVLDNGVEPAVDDLAFPRGAGAGETDALSVDAQTNESLGEQLATVSMAAAVDTEVLDVAQPGEDTGELDFELELPDESETGEPSFSISDAADFPDPSEDSFGLPLDEDEGRGETVEEPGEISIIDEDFASLFEEGEPDAFTLEIDDDDGKSGEPVAELNGLGFGVEQANEVEDNLAGEATEHTDFDLDALFDAENLGDTTSGVDDLTELNLDELDVPAPGEESLLDFDLSDFDVDEPDDLLGETSVLDFDLDSLGLEDETGLVEPIEDEHEIIEVDSEPGGPAVDDQTLIFDEALAGDGNEVQTKLELAQAYVDMGDNDGAKDILAEVLSEGDEQQRGVAETLLKSID